MPTSALINLSHGIRTENGMQKLTAVVKPQPAINHQGSHPSELSAGGSQKGHLGALNHSPRSLFIPMKVRPFPTTTQQMDWSLYVITQYLFVSLMQNYTCISNIGFN